LSSREFNGFKSLEEKRKYHKEYSKKWAKNNAERYRENIYKWRKENPKKVRKIQRKCYLKNRDKIILKNRQKREEQKLLIFKHYGNKCACCGETRKEFLCIDHINGGGTKHHKELHNQGTYLYAWLIKNNFPKGFRVLCHNCNMAIGLYGYCPHQIEKGEITKEEAIKISNKKALTRRKKFYKKRDESKIL